MICFIMDGIVCVTHIASNEQDLLVYLQIFLLSSRIFPENKLLLFTKERS